MTIKMKMADEYFGLGGIRLMALDRASRAFVFADTREEEVTALATLINLCKDIEAPINIGDSMIPIGYIIVDLSGVLVSRMYKMYERDSIYGRAEKMNSSFSNKPYKVRQIYITKGD